MHILVTGGSGFIGSIMIRQLLDKGYDVTVVDISKATDKRAKTIVADLCSKNNVENLFSKNRFDAIFHFAGLISVKESMENPGKYFSTNIGMTLNLLEQMTKYKTNKIIFSSTAAVYGEPQKIPIPEDHPKTPTNPYGESKLAIEKILTWYDKVHNIKSISLRYFNAAGASLDSFLGEKHVPETHIIPLAVEAAFSGKQFKLYGIDYQTKDGTCIRDYVHVEDLCQAHLLALEALNSGHKTDFYNVGTGNGYSNKEVIQIVEKISKRKIDVEIEKRRVGDSPILVADATKIKNELGWKPKFSDLETIVRTSHNFYKSLNTK